MTESYLVASFEGGQTGAFALPLIFMGWSNFRYVKLLEWWLSGPELIIVDHYIFKKHKNINVIGNY